ncbi:hypothetical protein OPT61_g2994 [Boeremia exigua]|uniref:Uncharacterized protein n=1 Tax=Boeremia exigua TaxID=749465 RepID=A0ACC2IJS9_9PLEO|nr:hypothetical protein OPT61_g2994 [Boeremia exigua]
MDPTNFLVFGSGSGLQCAREEDATESLGLNEFNASLPLLIEDDPPINTSEQCDRSEFISKVIPDWEFSPEDLEWLQTCYTCGRVACSCLFEGSFQFSMADDAPNSKSDDPTEPLSKDAPDSDDINTSAPQDAVPVAMPLDPSGLAEQPPARVPRSKSTRTRIGDFARAALENSFVRNQYPKKKEVTSLHTVTQLSKAAIRNWFSNARSRKTRPTPTSCDGRANRLSRASLESLDRSSPKGSNISLERWFEAPDPHLSTAAAASISYLPTWTSNIPVVVPIGSFKNDGLPKQQTNRNTSTRRAGSASSRGSGRSSASRGSCTSVDSRGSRRGRRQWKQNMRQARSMSCDQEEMSQGSHEEKSANYKRQTFFCTWATCNKTFATAFEWSRHEQAIHYCPFRWVCLYEAERSDIEFERFNRCKYIPEDQRVFWRSDQLAQHVKRIHNVRLTQTIERSWRSENPAFDSIHLACGFCGHLSPNWKERVSHVKACILRGAKKEQWSFRRKVPVWACQRLIHPEGFPVRLRDEDTAQACILCDKPLLDSEIPTHAEIHRLSSCSNQPYSTMDGLVEHLRLQHGATGTIWQNPGVLQLYLYNTECPQPSVA